MPVEFVDTNVLVYAHDVSAGPKREAAAALVAKLLDERTGCLSVQVLMELAATLTRKIPNPLSPTAAADILRDFSTWPVFAPGAGDVIAALGIGERHRIAFWDAMIVRAASELGAEVIWSEDLGDGQEYEGVTVRNPFSGRNP
jgi:predicted nucleic acid-binding protein